MTLVESHCINGTRVLLWVWHIPCMERDCKTTYLTHRLALTGELGCGSSHYVRTERMWYIYGEIEKTDFLYRYCCLPTLVILFVCTLSWSWRVREKWVAFMSGLANRENIWSSRVDVTIKLGSQPPWASIMVVFDVYYSEETEASLLVREKLVTGAIRG